MFNLNLYTLRCITDHSMTNRTEIYLIGLYHHIHPILTFIVFKLGSFKPVTCLLFNRFRSLQVNRKEKAYVH